MDYIGVDSSENGSIEVEETVQGTRRLEGNQSKSKRAGLVMSVARIEKNLRKGNYANRIGTSGAVYTAGVLEYLCAEVLELAGEAAKQNKRIRIIPRHIMMAIANDEELKVLLKDVQIPDAGVMPFIHPVLMKPNTKANDGENVEQEI